MKIGCHSALEPQVSNSVFFRTHQYDIKISVLHLNPEGVWQSSFVLALGAAYGTAKSGTGIAAMSVMRPELIMKSIIPVVMAGIIAIYGLVVAVLITGNLGPPEVYSLYT